MISVKLDSIIKQMNSSDLLKALNAQNHKKHEKKQKLKSIPEEKGYESGGDNEFEKMALPEPLPEPPSFLSEILKHQQSENLVSTFIQDGIKKLQKQREKNTYLMFNEGHLVYLNQLKEVSESKNQFGTNAILDFMDKRFNNVTSDLENGNIMINRDRSILNKEQMDRLAELDTARLIKIKDGSIRSKLDLLQVKMEEMEKIDRPPPKDTRSIEQINKKLEENLDFASYGLQSQKTKIAQDYVKHMSSQRREMKKRERLRQERAKKIQQERQAEVKQAEQMKDLAKKQQLLQKIQIKRKKREEQQQQMATKQAQIERFLAVYRQKMPIYKKKQKEYQDKFLKPERAYQEQKLKQIKQKKKSYSLNDIVDHQKKYEEIRSKQQQRKSQQKQLLMKEMKVNTKEYYRGSVHSYVEEIDRQRRQKNISLLKLGRHRKQRMKEYGKSIGESHKPKIDESKRSELIQVLELERMKKNRMQKKYRQIFDEDGEDLGVESYYEEIKPKNRYLEGNKFMQIAKMRKKNKSSFSVDIQSKAQLSQETLNLRSLKKPTTKQDRAETEREIWQLRAKNMEQMSQNLSSPKQFEQVKISFQNFDKKAADRQSLLKHSNMSIEDHIQQKGALDNFYLESIKHKMKLLQ